MEKEVASGGLRTLERGLSVMAFLGRAEAAVHLSDIAKALELPVGTCHRLLTTLVKFGYVEQDPRDRLYQLGLRTLELRGANATALNIASAVRPHLRNLMLQSGLRAHLALHHGEEVVYIDRVDTADTLARFVPIGRTAPTHATGLGKAILAFLPEREVRQHLRRHPLERFTDTTITDVDALLAELAVTRERGYALDRSEHGNDTCCIGAAIFDYTGKAIAALSIAGSEREISEHVARLAPLVRSAAAEASHCFGFQSAA